MRGAGTRGRGHHGAWPAVGGAGGVDHRTRRRRAGVPVRPAAGKAGAVARPAEADAGRRHRRRTALGIPGDRQRQRDRGAEPDQECLCCSGFRQRTRTSVKLFLLRNTPWPNGVEDRGDGARFRGGGWPHARAVRRRSAYPVGAARPDRRRPPDLPSWLVARKPAHGLEFLREALGDDAGPAFAPEIPIRRRSVPDPEPEPTPAPGPGPSGRPSHSRDDPASSTAIPLGRRRRHGPAA